MSRVSPCPKELYARAGQSLTASCHPGSCSPVTPPGSATRYARGIGLSQSSPPTSAAKAASASLGLVEGGSLGRERAATCPLIPRWLGPASPCSRASLTTKARSVQRRGGCFGQPWGSRQCYLRAQFLRVFVPLWSETLDQGAVCPAKAAKTPFQRGVGPWLRQKFRNNLHLPCQEPPTGGL